MTPEDIAAEVALHAMGGEWNPHLTELALAAVHRTSSDPIAVATLEVWLRGRHGPDALTDRSKRIPIGRAACSMLAANGHDDDPARDALIMHLFEVAAGALVAGPGTA